MSVPPQREYPVMQSMMQATPADWPPSHSASRPAGSTGRPNRRLARQPDRQRARCIAGRQAARQPSGPAADPVAGHRGIRLWHRWLPVSVRAGRLAVQPAGSPGSWFPGLPVGRAAGPHSAVRQSGKHTV